MFAGACGEERVIEFHRVLKMHLLRNDLHDAQVSLQVRKEMEHAAQKSSSQEDEGELR